MDLTYREKALWISLLTQLIASTLYFVELHRGAVTLFVLLHVLIVIIVLQIVLQSLLALTSRREPKDERDIAIERTAYRNAYFVLVAALVGGLTALTVSVHVPTLHHFHLSVFQAMNHLLFFLFAAEIAKLASQLALYRRTT